MIRTENELWRAIIPVVKAGVAGYAGVAVKRAYQPTTQADGKKPRLVLHRVSSRRYGFQGRRQERKCGEDDEIRIFEIETWRKEDTFQANALVDRKPDDEAFTAKDLLEALGGRLQGDAAIRALKKQGIGILRITEIQETPYQDDREKWRFSVSLRFTLTYTQTTEREIPAAKSIEAAVHRV
ncbi:hypothetical protein LJC36_00240 [Desulfovibrio sp. OttesenSCG-928-C14]|nr:hypothetical protein [Desulfovibrio sp. OttesenSCG-928-C14]